MSDTCSLLTPSHRANGTKNTAVQYAATYLDARHVKQAEVVTRGLGKASAPALAAVSLLQESQEDMLAIRLTEERPNMVMVPLQFPISSLIVSQIRCHPQHGGELYDPQQVQCGVLPSQHCVLSQT